MNGHDYAFEGGKILRKICASWFVSYSYFYYKIDKYHKNWKKLKTAQYRIARFNSSLEYHKKWLEEISNMSDKRLNRNTINLKAEEIKQMCKELIKVVE